MSELRLETLTIPAAPLGPDNPLPQFDRPAYQPVLSGRPESDPDAGYIPDILPYRAQDGYSRNRHPTEIRVAVLENQMLRATFLLDYGGRLQSLLHRPSGRELLFVNPMLQPANLAIRNAWFSGGVEWNMGIIGHTPFTCAPLFAARVEGHDGTPILRLYEWERLRGAAYQIDAYLPDGSELLYVRCRIVNPFDHAIPIYWWSNIAVPERDELRVLVPAQSAYRYALSVEDLGTVPVPVVDGQDITYTTRGRRAADYFFQLPPGARPWIAALDGAGKGLIQVSTDGLRGRKLFLWGTGSGGQRWQEWLNTPGHRYLEIQAGLAPTQLEYAALPPRAGLAWLEAYGLMQADPARVHGSNWNAATAEVETALETMLPRAAFEAEFARGAAWADQPPAEIIQRGSGWGALEALRRRAAGERPFASAGLDFSGALGPEQQPWLDLLQTGQFPASASDTLAAGILVQPEWRALLENALLQQPESGWEAWLHLGTMRLHDGDSDGARQAWETSLKHQRTPWALRNLAVLMRRSGQALEAAIVYRQAFALRPDLLPLLIETGMAMIAAGRAASFLELLDTVPAAIRRHGRVTLLEVQAGMAADELERVGRLFDGGFEIDDYREGDEILTELWAQYHARRLSNAENIPLDAALIERVEREFPLPRAFDFRMK